MSFDRALLLFGATKIVQVGLDHVESACRIAARAGIDQDGRVVSIEQSVGEVVATDAEVSHSNVGRPLAADKTARYFHSESVIAQKNIADSGDQNAWAVRSG